ncbi:tRNA1(Val) (adenine(37)-N6)-methyltransferase [Bacillus spongiae]|uniref:tRNA1(Val) (Adenine(37)-N6)-methyltransferase n=1 Tax=Bacillus spongiae TaxID=2683610 RepID=A0ABU8HJP9_9BACI
MLKGDERLDYLLAENLRIIQSPSVFSFSIDAVLLANFVHVPIQKGNIIDLCSGNGIVPLLLSKRTNADILGIEIQERLYDMAVRSVEYNGLNDRIQFLKGDIKEIPALLGRGKHDVVTCNPPYFKTPQKEQINPNEYLAIARHELLCTLEDVISVTAALLKQGGKAAFVHRPGRLIEIVTLMKKYQLEPKKMRLVYPRMGKEANILLIEGIKNGKPDLRVLPPLYIFEEGNYTEEVQEMLYGK